MAGSDIWDRELLLVTGKGGVGKTTVTAALARAAHAAGRKVLVGEVTSDVTAQSPVLTYFGRPSLRSETPVELAHNLFGIRITPSTGHKLFLRAALRVSLVVNAAMRSAALNRFLMAAPTFPEIGTLYHLVSILRKKSFDHIILDLPATGHAVGLVKLPRTVLKVLPKGLIGDAIRDGLDVLTDPARGAAVVVTLPEAMPVTEAAELRSQLEELDIAVRAMILNCMPRSRFTDEQSAALDAFLRTREEDRVLGTREFRRLERALEARDEFRGLVAPGQGHEISLLRSAEPATIVKHVADALGPEGTDHPSPAGTEQP